MTSDWTTQAFRDALLAWARRRVPAHEAEDVVQTALAEALASDTRPDEPLAARRWLYGVLRNKIVDYHRRARRELTDDQTETRAAAPRESVDDLLRWAMRELPDGTHANQTLDWLLREADGETLEDIAESAKLSPAQVRQRVSRLRRHYRARWALALALVGALAAIAYFATRGRSNRPALPHVPSLGTPPEQLAARDRAERLRAHGLAACADARWQACLDDLDAARAIDLEGDARPDVRAARQRAFDALHPPAPTPPATPIENDVLPSFGLGSGQPSTSSRTHRRHLRGGTSAPDAGATTMPWPPSSGAPPTARPASSAEPPMASAAPSVEPPTASPAPSAEPPTASPAPSAEPPGGGSI